MAFAFSAANAQQADEQSAAAGMAENAWDFTDPNGVPGFGPMTSTYDVRVLMPKLAGAEPQGTDNNTTDNVTRLAQRKVETK